MQVAAVVVIIKVKLMLILDGVEQEIPMELVLVQ